MQKKFLRIVVIMQSPDLGGAETFMVSLVDQFTKGGSSICVAANKGKFLNLISEKKIKTYEIPMILDIIGNLRGLIKTILLLPYSFYFYSRLLNNFKKDNIDVILMSNFTEKLFVTLIAPFFNIPVVWIEYGSLHEVLKKNYYSPKVVYRLLNKIPKAVIVPSKNTMKSLISDANVSFRKIKLVNLGIKYPKIKKVKKEGFIIGTVSRLAPEKGQEYLIKAMKIVLKQVPDAKLRIIGSGPDESRLRKLIMELSLGKKVELPGFVDNLDEEYSKMDIFIFPSVWQMEGFGLVMIEAMSHHLPVIAFDNGPSKEIVDDSKTGIIVSSKNEVNLAKAIVDLAKNKNKRIEMGESGYRKFLEKYRLENTSETIYNILYDAAVN